SAGRVQMEHQDHAALTDVVHEMLEECPQSQHVTRAQVADAAIELRPKRMPCNFRGCPIFRHPRRSFPHLRWRMLIPAATRRVLVEKIANGQLQRPEPAEMRLRQLRRK